MTQAERKALERLVESVRRQIPKPTEQPGDDDQIAAHDQAQQAQRMASAESTNAR